MIIKSFVRNYNIISDFPRTNMVLFRITENEPSKMHNVRPYVYSRPWYVAFFNNIFCLLMVIIIKCMLHRLAVRILYFYNSRSIYSRNVNKLSFLTTSLYSTC